MTASSHACESDVMKHRTISALVMALALAGACKKAAPAAPATVDNGSAAVAVAAPDGSGMRGEHGMKGEHGGEHEMAMPPELTKFHDLLKPLWHAEKGDKRTADTCAAVPALQAQANAVAKSTPDAKADAAKWAAATKELVDATAALKDPCDKKDAAAFEPALKRVHEGFHGALEASGGGEGGEHGEHGHHE